MNDATRPWCAFVHTDRRQRLPALVAAYSLKTRGGGDDNFDVRILTVEGSVLDGRNDGRKATETTGGVWDHTHPKVFSFLRRSVPERMNYRGRAVLIDPDIVAIDSLCPLFESDMQGAAVMARYVEAGYLGVGAPYRATSVMLMDCAKLTYWSMACELEEYFAGRLGFRELIQLQLEPPGAIGSLEKKWNDLDELSPETRLLHFTRPSTQPWLTGLPMDDRIVDPTHPLVRPQTAPGRGNESFERYHLPNPDPTQCRVFFELLGECVADGLIDPAWIESEIAAGLVRRDLFDVLKRYGYQPGEPREQTLEKAYFGDSAVAPW
ncbi:MAG: hypothetical protein DWQ08_07920 [Proteobacteria bacterium]|nr:MAG: hypothetical protein DWQ08_07920 [Pseudomonadota bacterium]